MSVYQIYLLQCDEFRCQTPDVRSLARSLARNESRLELPGRVRREMRNRTTAIQWHTHAGIHTRSTRCSRIRAVPCDRIPLPTFFPRVREHFGRVCARDRDERGSISVRRFYVTFDTKTTEEPEHTACITRCEMYNAKNYWLKRVRFLFWSLLHIARSGF